MHLHRSDDKDVGSERAGEAGGECGDEPGGGGGGGEVVPRPKEEPMGVSSAEDRGHKAHAIADGLGDQHGSGNSRGGYLLRSFS